MKFCFGGIEFWIANQSDSKSVIHMK